MAEQERIADEESQSDEQPEPDRGNGHQEEAASYEQELADYLQERIKPGLNRGAIPLLARSIAKEIAHGQHPQGASEDGEADDEPGADGEPPSDFEADMHDLQAELGEDWILRFSVQGDDGWLTAEKDDGSQRVEVGLLNEGGGRPT
jgi:hypothetical protein